MTIAEVSRKYEISADTLRYYERIGLIPPVPRTKSGLRDYDEESCGWVELMKCMRAAGVQIRCPQGVIDRTEGAAACPYGRYAKVPGPAEYEN